MKIYNAVVFDFDGTLFDSYEIGLRQVAELAAQEGLIITHEIKTRLYEKWGQTGVTYLQDSFGVDRERAKDLLRKWQHLEIMGAPSFVRGAPEALDWLREEGYFICLLTSRDRLTVMQYLRRACLNGYFAHITAHEDTRYHKPDERAFDDIFQELRKHGVPKKQCLFVGDTAIDIETGRNAGIDTLVVETGPYWHGHHLTHPMPRESVISSVKELPDWMKAVREVIRDTEG